MRLSIIAPAALALAVAAGAWGYSQGYAVAEGRMLKAIAQEQAAVARAAELASRKESERLASETARAELVQQLEDQAYAEASSGACLPISRVLRLNRR